VAEPVAEPQPTGSSFGVGLLDATPTSPTIQPENTSDLSSDETAIEETVTDNQSTAELSAGEGDSATESGEAPPKTGRKRRRRRRRRRRSSSDGEADSSVNQPDETGDAEPTQPDPLAAWGGPVDTAAETSGESTVDETSSEPGSDGDGQPPKRRRRRRRRRRGNAGAAGAETSSSNQDTASSGSNETELDDPLAAWQPPGETTISDSGSESVDGPPPDESAGEAILEEARDAAVAGDDELSMDLTEDDEGNRSTKDVPTWEDALSQLPRNPGGGSGNSGKSGSGGRKRRRR
ncbi:MAG TPA: hypothetical protein DER64_17840, partial [Planctomycetaceae bacterium]|nr:hypothetical protein [Planctomycetaceae bacterium]